MSDINIRIYVRDESGALHDAEETYEVSSFAGQVPVVGDVILEPGVPAGLNRELAVNRKIWTVVGRIFNPRDLENYVALIVEQRKGEVLDQVWVG